MNEAEYAVDGQRKEEKNTQSFQSTLAAAVTRAEVSNVEEGDMVAAGDDDDEGNRQHVCDATCQKPMGTIICRFRLPLHRLNYDRRVQAQLFVIAEYQHRGQPHVHHMMNVSDQYRTGAADEVLPYVSKYASKDYN